MKRSPIIFMCLSLLVPAFGLAMPFPHNNPYINPGFFPGTAPQHTPLPYLQAATAHAPAHAISQNTTIMDYNNPFETYAPRVAADKLLADIKQKLDVLAPIRSNLEVLTQQRNNGTITPAQQSAAEEYTSIMPDSMQQAPYAFLEDLDRTLKTLEGLIKNYRRTKGSDLFFVYAETQRRHIHNLTVTSGLTTFIAWTLADGLIQEATDALANLRNALTKIEDPSAVPAEEKEKLQNFFASNPNELAPLLEKSWYTRDDQYKIGKILKKFKAASHTRIDQLRRLHSTITPFPELHFCNSLLLTIKILEQSCIGCFGRTFKERKINRVAHTGNKIGHALKETGKAIGSVATGLSGFMIY